MIANGKVVPCCLIESLTQAELFSPEEICNVIYFQPVLKIKLVIQSTYRLKIFPRVKTLFLMRTT